MFSLLTERDVLRKLNLKNQVIVYQVFLFLDFNRKCYLIEIGFEFGFMETSLAVDISLNYYPPSLRL